MLSFKYKSILTWVKKYTSKARSRSVGIMVMALLGWSCSASGQSHYTQDMLREAKISNALLQVAVPLETAFYMAGAKIVDQKDDELVLKLMRCKLKKTCDVDYVASYNQETGFHEMRVPQKSIILDFGGNVRIDVSKSN